MDGKALRRGMRLQHVPRWGIVPTVRPQNVAAHSHGVAVTALWLMNNFVNCDVINKASVLEYAIRHDEYESVTGDTPAVAKMTGMVVDNTPKLAFGGSTRMIVKVADFLEALAFIKADETLGNRGLDEIYAYVLNGARDYWVREDAALTFGLHTFDDLWHVYHRETALSRHPGMERQ